MISPWLLEELARFGIPVIADSPGVGMNLQDHYEVAVQSKVPKNFPNLRGCTFNGAGDPCLDRWRSPVLGDRGTYALNGLAASILLKTSAAFNDDYDAFLFGGPVNFRGYFPGCSVNITDANNWFTWVVLKPHPRNRAGSVTLRSADPLDVPTVAYNYFETSGEDPSLDLMAMREAIALARAAFQRELIPVREVLPSSDKTSDEDLDTYIRDTAWDHHASSRAACSPNRTHCL